MGDSRSADGSRGYRVGKGSLTGHWKPRPGACPNIRGGITIERDLRAGSRLWLTGWTQTIAGGDFVSLVVEIADKDIRSRLRHSRQLAHHCAQVQDVAESE